MKQRKRTLLHRGSAAPDERSASAAGALLLCAVFLLGAAACTSGNPCSGFKDTGVPQPNLSYDDVSDGRARQPDGRPTILLIGDSFAYGCGVSENETVAAYLEGLLDEQDYQIINLGINGYNLPLAFERLQAMLPHYPDSRLVLFEYFTNDYYPASSAINDPNYFSFAKSMYMTLFSHFHPEPDGIYWFRAKFVEPGYKQWLEGEDIRPLLLECKMWGPLNNVIPWLEQEDLTLAIFHPPFSSDPEAEAILKGFAENSTRIIYLPVGEALASQMTQDYHLREERLPDNHLNPAGNEKVSRELLKQLVDAGLLESGN